MHFGAGVKQEEICPQDLIEGDRLCFGFPTCPFRCSQGCSQCSLPSATFQTTRLTGAVGYKYYRNVPIDLVCASAGQGSSREAAVGGCGPTSVLEKRCSRCRYQWTCDDVFEINLVICLVSWSDGRDQSEAWTGLDVSWRPEDMGREARAGRLIVNGPLAAVAEGLRLSLLVRP